MNRVVPGMLHAGDSMKFQLSLPLLEDNETWNTASMNMRLQSSVDVHTAAVAGTLEGGLATFQLAAAASSNLVDGVWRYQVQAVGNAATTTTLEAGVIEVKNALAPAATHNEKMVAMLEYALEEKVAGRGDVLEYAIGDRDLKTMTLEQLRVELSTYRLALQRERRPRRNWLEVPRIR